MNIFCINAPLGFGRKQEFQTFTTDITNKDDLKEIKKIRHMLNPNEEVFVVARQSRFKPGGSKFTPNVVFGTDRRAAENYLKGSKR